MQNKVKRYVLPLFLVLAVLSGCEEFKDIDKDVFVSMIGIDLSDDPEKPYKVILKLYVPNSSFKQNPKPEYTYLTKNGETISEAVRILETHIDKELEFGHEKLIIIGEELIKANNTNEIPDFLLRRPDIQMISWVAIGRPSAEEIVKMIPEGETAAYPALFNYFDENGTESPYIVTTFLFDWRRRMLEDGLDPILPIIEIDEKESHFKINKSIVLADKKVPYELNSHSTLLVNILSKNTEIAELLVEEEDHHFIAKVDTIKAKYKVKVRENNQILIDLDLSFLGYISESKSPLLNKHLSYYNKLMEAEAKKQITDFLKEMLQAGYDPIGFGLNYKASTLPHKRMSKAEWKEAYKNAEINITVHGGLKSTGSIQ